MKGAKFLAIVGGMSLLLAEAVSVEAAAASLRVRCEVRSNRSKISVDGKKIKNFSGLVHAVVTSTNGLGEVPAAPKPIVMKQVEFDFDSDDGDIADGATAIDSNFINPGDPHVTASIPELGLTATATCKVKN